MQDADRPLGAVLAGGAGERLGGAKATVELGGRPLIEYPLAAFAAAGLEVVVVAKGDTELPPLAARVLTEPGRPRHPLVGILTALAHGAGRAVVACPCDAPFADAGLLAQLASATGTAAARGGGRLQPLLARYEPGDAPVLRRAVERGQSATAALAALEPTPIDVPERAVFNVNTPADLMRARELLARTAGDARR